MTPSVISNDFAGVVNLQIGGLTNGEPVLVERYFDFNGNGAPDTQEVLLQSFYMTNGGAFVIGGVTNLHIPGDVGSSATAISAQVYMGTAGFEQRFVGRHVYRVSSPFNRFAAVLTPFTVTNSPYSAEVNGYVRSNGTNVPNASVVLFLASANDMQPRIGAATDSNGRYSLKAPPGAYMLLPFKPGYVADFSTTPMVALAPGASVSTNVPLSAATRTISGRVTDLANGSRGLGGLLMPAESQDGKLGVAFSDSNGNFTAPAMPGGWQIGPDDSGVGFLGYVPVESRPQVDCTAGNISGLSIQLQKGTAMFTGFVRNQAAQPMPGVSLYAHDQSWTYSGMAVADESGRYFMLASAGMWDVEVDESMQQSPSYVFTHPGGTVNLVAGQVVNRDFTGVPAPYVISGYVKTATGAPVEFVDIYGWATMGTETYNIGTETDDQGYYSLNVPSGQWTIVPACEGDDGLAIRGFRCVANRSVTVTSGNVQEDFTVQPCTGVQILTTSLPNGTVGTPYDMQLQAEGCGSFRFWSLSPGSGQLPPGLNLISDSGLITGNPFQAGTYTFSVRVNDGSLTADRQFTVTIVNNFPLGIFMGMPPEATNGVPYSAQLQADGGRPPYSWSMAPGSSPLPPGLSLGSNGTIWGTPTTLGEFYFYVQVTDTTPTTVESSGPFFIIVRPPPPPPLSITTTSLPDATVGQMYSAYLQASGGYLPYSWGLAVGSAPLPPGLMINGMTGEIYGAPTASGTYSFRVSLNDQTFYQLTRVLTIVVKSGTITQPTLASASHTPDGKFTFVINGVSGITYTIQTSSDLQNWGTLRTTNAPSSSFLFVDDSPLPGTRYYRILVGQ